MRGADVEVEGLLEVGHVGVEERVRDRPADVVDDRVEPAELVVRRLREAGDRVGVAEVGRDDERAAAGGPDPLGDGLELGGGPEAICYVLYPLSRLRIARSRAITPSA